MSREQGLADRRCVCRCAQGPCAGPCSRCRARAGYLPPDAPADKIERLCPTGASSAGSIRRTSWSCTSGSCRIPRRWTPPRAPPSSARRPRVGALASAPPARSAPSADAPSLTAVVGAVNLAESIRRYGHLASTIDPLGSAPIGDPSLDPETHGVTEAELRALPASLVGGPLAEVTRERLGGNRPPARGVLLEHRLRPRAHLRARRARVAATSHRSPHLPRTAAAGREDRAARSDHGSRDVRALPPQELRRQDAILDRGARHHGADPRRADRRLGGGGRQARAHRHGASRAPERARARHAEELRADSRRVQGRRGRPAVPRRPRLDGRREVPRRRPRARSGGIGAGSGDLDAAEPEPPRVREPGRGRHGARRVHGHVGLGVTGHRQGRDAACPDSRRRRLPRPGHRGRDAEPLAAPALRRGRHRPHHREQPDRLHRHGAPVLLHVCTRAALREASRSRSST